jgi:murein DD-endopeptidase MepM/ murein hydrolase activator NlpD
MKKIKLCIFIIIMLFSAASIKEANAAIIRIHSNRDKIATDEEVSIYGKILPRKSKVVVTVWGSLTSKGKYKKITTATTNKYGRYSVNLSPKRTKFFKVSYQKSGHRIQSNHKKVIVSDDLSIITPYANEYDITRAGSYSSSENCPWGFAHPGLDFFIDVDSTPIQAVNEGVISNITIAKEDGQMGWHVAIMIEYGEYTSMYNLETFSQSDEIGALAEANLFVENGQIVKQGDIIANLINGADSAHVDFGVGYEGDRVCPEPYLTDEARDSVRRVLDIESPDWEICYE